MATVPSRELRNNTRAILDRVADGEEVTITVDGRAVATLHPAGRRPRFIGRAEFARSILAHRADPALRAVIRDLAPDTTDQLAIE
jgi:prevent-host-death family protein